MSDLMPDAIMPLVMACLNAATEASIGFLFTRIRFVAVHLSPLMTGQP